ncbi:HupE/UreJ family protein [Alsobacter sp. R-9]
MTPLARTLGAATLFAITTPALAHTGAAPHVHGLLDGLAHPFGGLDHLAAMVGVGAWAGMAGGRALWAWPLAFVAAMAAAAGLGAAGLPLPFGEAGITLSLVALAGLLVLGRRVPVGWGAAACALFATMHGWAHGAEMPANAAGLAYGVGFLAATALLHASGLAAVRMLRPAAPATTAG